MKSYVVATVLMLMIASSAGVAQSRLRQTKSNPVIQKPASKKAISTFVDFFEYVKKSEPDIVEDRQAQERWLTKGFRESMMKSNSAWVEYLKKNPDYKPGGPTNSSFTGVWNQPTTYSIVSTREYDYRDKDNPLALRTMIDVLYVWGKEKDICNQYPGVRNLHTFMFIFEDGAWKLDDIYIFNDEFTGSESLRQYFNNDRPD
jgi:hypothetical protein